VRIGARLAGGTVSLAPELARAALAPLATALAASVEDTAEAIVAVTTAAIARALRQVSLGVAGEGPPEAVIAYGGAAGLHVAEVARELGLPRVIVPPAPGLQCALGALAAPVVVEALAAWREPLEDRPSAALRARAATLAHQVSEALAREGGVGQIERVAHVRYDGQGLEAELELPLETLTRARFEAAHARARGHCLERAVEITRLAVRGRRPPGGPAAPIAVREIGWPRVGSRALVCAGRTARAPIYRRERLRPGRELAGPAIVEELSATLYLPEGARARVLELDDAIEVTLA
jgi:N-methylhydantoinase A